MVFYKNHHAYVLIGKESVFGTPVSATKDIGLIQNSNWTITNGFTRSHGLSSVNAQAKASGPVIIRGVVEVDFQHGRLVEYATGGTVTHAETTGDWKHTFALSDTLPSMTFEDGADESSDAVQKFEGVKVESLTVALDANSPMKLRANMIAESVVDNTSATSAVISGLVTHRAHQATISTGTEGGESAISDGAVHDFEFTINNNGGGEFVAPHGLGSRKIAAADPSSRLLDFRFTKVFESNTELERFLGTTSPLDTGAEIADFGLVFNIHNNVALGSGRRELKIDLSDCFYDSVNKVGRIGNFIIMEFAGGALTIDDLFTVDNIADTSW